MLDFLNERFRYNASVLSELKRTVAVGILVTLLLILIGITISSYSIVDLLLFGLVIVFAAVCFQYGLHLLIIKCSWNTNWAIKYEVLRVLFYLFLVASFLFTIMVLSQLIEPSIRNYTLFIAFTIILGIIPITIKTLWTQNNRLTSQINKIRDTEKLSNNLELTIGDSSILFHSQTNKLLFIKSNENYIIAFEKDKKTHIRMTLKLALTQLKGSGFIQVHRSYLANSQFIKKIKSRHLLLTDNTKIPISRKFRKQFVDKHMKFNSSF